MTKPEIKLDSKGIIIGEPLRDFEGVLSGTPVFVGDKFSGASRDDKHSGTL
jgi:hypothetical protein